MVSGHIEGGRVELERSESERRPIVQRLTRIEGQVRGVRAMVEDDRYCLDELHQLSAITAALREVSLMILEQHVEQAIRLAESAADRAVALDDIRAVTRAAQRV